MAGTLEACIRQLQESRRLNGEWGRTACESHREPARNNRRRENRLGMSRQVGLQRAVRSRVCLIRVIYT